MANRKPARGRGRAGRERNALLVATQAHCITPHTHTHTCAIGFFHGSSGEERVESGKEGRQRCTVRRVCSPSHGFSTSANPPTTATITAAARAVA